MIKTKRFKLNVYEDRIIRVLRMYYDLMTVNEIADESGIHWKTTDRYLARLLKKKLVTREKNDKKVYWQAVRPDNN